MHIGWLVLKLVLQIACFPQGWESQGFSGLLCLSGAEIEREALISKMLLKLVSGLNVLILIFVQILNGFPL